MNWKNLKDNKCPHCGYELEVTRVFSTLYRHPQASALVCPNTYDCKGFRIGVQRRNEIVDSMREAASDIRHNEESNFEALQNL